MRLIALKCYKKTWNFSKKFNAGKAKKLNDDSNDAPDDEVETDTLPEDEIISDDMGDGDDPPLAAGGGDVPPDFDVNPINIEDEMRTSYLDYAMSVIVSRALPDVRDGLKPVHRRILFSMNENGYDYNTHRKSAR